MKIFLIHIFFVELARQNKINFVQRFCISDVLWSVAEQNMGGGFCIKAVTRYTLLADVFLFFFPTAVGIVLKNFKISFSVLDFGQRG
ncbi:hypothetical protein D4R87_00065 [bacterium]|nr:MAG: hypothetical protein D4R87_00065 [bacterium]